MSEEKIIYRPENIKIEGDEFIITEEGIDELENTMVEKLGVDFPANTMIQYFSTLTPQLAYAIGNPSSVDMNTLIGSLAGIETMIPILKKALKVPEALVNETKGVIYYELAKNKEELGKTIDQINDIKDKLPQTLSL